MEITSCPCCGCESEVRFGRTQKDTWAYVVCPGCGLQTSNHRGKNDKEAKAGAIGAWNRRSES